MFLLHVDRGPPIPVTGTTNWSVVVNIPTSGTHSLWARADDNAGNRRYSQEIFITTTGGSDTTPPTVTITSPANNATVPAGNITVSGTSQDNTGGSGINNVVLHVDRGPPIPVTGTTNWSVVVNLTKTGTRSLWARADDNAGNRRYSQEIFITVQ